MQPFYKSSKRRNYIGIRLINLNLQHDFGNEPIEIDSYYSDNSDASNDHSNTFDHSDSNDKKSISSFEDLFENIGYDSPVPHKFVVKIGYEAIKKYEPYPVRVYKIFEYELNKLSESEKFLKKYSSKKKCSNKEVPIETPSTFRHMIYEMMYHFFTTYSLRDLLDSYILLYYQFLVKYNIPEKDVKDIFYKCTNIADQVASQMSKIIKRPAYYPRRLENYHSYDFQE